MSQLRAPAARPDRREGGRHGRPGARAHSAPNRPRATPATPEGRIRPQLLRTALLPTIAALLSGAAAVIFTVRDGAVDPSPGLWAALGGSAALAVAAVAAAYLGAHRVAGAVLDRALTLRRASAQGQAELQRVVEQLRAGEPVGPRRPPPPPAPDGDAFDLLAQEMGRAQDAAVTAIVQASQLFSSTGNEQKVEVFVNLARRLQSLVHREIQILDELEHEVEDPDLLKGLFHVDHLATRIRRHAENLAVLGGAVSRRQWSNPVTMTEVLRSAIAEVEQYPRVKLVPPMDGTLRGHAVADVIHLLAELVENATVFSAPHTQVLLRVQRVTAGLALEVEDRGLGMPDHEQNRMNALLSDPDQVNVAHLLQDGRIGLFVVSALARRHGIAVRLQSNIYGGTQAVLVLPQTLLGTDPDTEAPPGAAPVPPPGAVHRPPADDGRTAPPAPPQVRAAQPQAVPGPAGQASPGQAPAGHPRDAQAPGSHAHAAPESRMPGPRGEAPPLPLRAERVDRPAPAASALDRPAQAAFTPEHADRPIPAALTPEHADRPAPGTFAPEHDARPGPAAFAPEHADRPAPAALVPERVDRPAPPAARPELPKRANQEHLVPQLREAPVPRVEDEHALHDPGLMAAFRRGVDLAEAQTAQTAQEEGTGDGYGGATGGPTALDAPLETLAPLPVRGAARAPAPLGRPQTGHDTFLPGHAVPEPRKDTTFKE
ncbi:ATP-binding protein [Streptomyces cyaneofuscatus]|uniref:sensor histidine kinase n=1 Tax=Streptomyces cyaneofuscatus TaxID=66883 RepID=UPI00364FB7AD